MFIAWMAWFVVGLVGVIASIVAYGWRASAIDHAWTAVSYLLLMSWLWIGASRLPGK